MTELPMARETDDSTSPQNKRLKTLNPQIESQSDPNQPETPPETDDSPPDRCAICFLDDGKAARGKIDCCDHYFCFLCIKEWAKTESRCPICRRRFNSIRRPPKVGVFIRERLVKVPLRDQGDKSGSVDDAYEEVACNVCNSMTDDHFMLLCDLCDGAAHTYCVGLGYTVPEGDWFCNDCIASRPELANGNGSDDECGEIPTEAVPVPFVSARDIVRDSDSSAVGRPRRNNPNLNQASAVPQVVGHAKAPPRVASISAESAARTLDRCRNVQTRIHTLRENWNGFRSGALSFPASSSTKAGCSSSLGNGVMSHERAGQIESSSSPSRQQLENRGGSDPYDIDKAWKMLEKAKSKQCIHKKNSSGAELLQFSKLPFSRSSASKGLSIVDPCPDRSGQSQSSFFAGCQQQQNKVGSGSHEVDKGSKMMEREKLKQHVHESTSSALKVLSRNANASEEANNVKSSLNTLKSQQLGAQNQGRLGMEKVDKGKERQSRVTTQEALESVLGISCSNSSPGLFIPPFPRNRNRPASFQKSQAAPSMVNEQNCSASSIMEETSNSFCGKPELSTSSGNLEEVSEESRARKVDDEAKSEIQSLVKMNVKLLSKDTRLGVDAFKQIARAATHTVLAACGLEHHHKYAVYSFPNLVCRHSDQLQLPHKSNLMRKACRDCFYGFVKDVVSSILQNHDGFQLRRSSHKQKL